MVVDLRCLAIDDALASCEHIFNEREKWRRHLHKRVPEIIESVLGMLSHLADTALKTSDR